jgi:hypothetical protein
MNDATTCNGNSDIKFILSNNEMNISTTGSDPQLLFDKVIFSKNRTHIINIEINSSIQTKLQLFFSKNNKSGYSEDMSIIIDINKGDNSIYMPILEVGLEPNFRLDPSCGQGKFILKKMEIRSATI